MIHLPWDTFFSRFVPGHCDSVSNVIGGESRTPLAASSPIRRTCSQPSGTGAEQKFTGGTTFSVTHRKVPIPELKRNVGGSEDNNN